MREFEEDRGAPRLAGLERGRSSSMRATKLQVKDRR